MSLRVMPLAFSEFVMLYRHIHGNSRSYENLFDLYRGIGGLPGLLHTDLSEDLVGQLQRDVYNTIALRDVVARHGIRDLAGFEAVARFAMDNVGSTRGTSPLPPDIRRRARRKLEYVDAASRLEDLKTPPGNKLHQLEPDREGQHAIWINDQFLDSLRRWASPANQQMNSFVNVDP